MTVYPIPDVLPMPSNPSPKHTRAYEARQIEDGAQRLPGGLLPSEAAQALQQLLDAGYADSKAGVIARALIDAEKRSSA